MIRTEDCLQPCLLLTMNTVLCVQQGPEQTPALQHICCSAETLEGTDTSHWHHCAGGFSEVFCSKLQSPVIRGTHSSTHTALKADLPLHPLVFMWSCSPVSPHHVFFSLWQEHSQALLLEKPLGVWDSDKRGNLLCFSPPSDYCSPQAGWHPQSPGGELTPSCVCPCSKI